MAVEVDNPTGATVRDIIRRYYTLWWTYSFAGGFLFGVYPIFLKARGLTQFQINSVLAVYFVVLFLTDVPTGAFADALGRRRSFLTGTALRVTAFIVYFFAHSYVVFLIAESIDGIGTTFCNGAIDAWGVDALDAAGYEELKDRLFSRISQLSSIGFMGSALIGAYVADVDIAWPWLLGAAGYAVSAVVGARLMRDEHRHAASVAVRALPAQVAARMRDGFRDGFKMKPVMMLSAAGALTFAAWAPYWLEWPVLFNERFAVGVWIIGWIYSGLTLARLIGAEMTVRFATDEAGRAARVALLVALASALLFTAGLLGHQPLAALGALFAMNLCTGAMQPLVQSWFNEQIPSAQRATLLSFSSTFQTMGGSIGLLAGGYVSDAAGIPVEWQMAGLISLCAAPLYWALRQRVAPGAVVASSVD
jgi:MFS family permease